MNGLYDEFRIAVHSVWQRRWLALAVAWVLCVLGWLAVAMIPNSYQSRARVLVQMKSILPDQSQNDALERQRQIDQVEQTLTSAVNLEKVIRATDLGQNISSSRQMEGMVGSLRGKIQVVSEEDSFFEITATSSDSSRSDGENAKLAHDIVQKLIDIFIEENLAGGRGETRKSLQFYDDQLALRQKELEQAEARRVAFETENLGLLPGVGSVSQRLENARSELKEIDIQLSSAQSALAAINAQLGGTPATIAAPGVPGSGGTRGLLAQAQSQLTALRSRGLTDSHPDIVALKRRISDLETRAASEPAGSSGVQTPNPAYSSLQSIQAERQANVQALTARKRSLEADLTAMRSKQASEPGVAAEQARINRDYEVLKAQYDRLLEEREELRLRGQVETETDALRFSVPDPPTNPTSPVAPNRPLLLLMVLAAGLAGGVGVAFAHAQINASFSTVGKLEKISGLPVLGSISQTLTNKQRVLRKRKMRWFYGATAGLGMIFGVLLIVEFIQRGSVV
ncbi:XrtA system polysaccharide chain length determinant [Alterisphingorhabdus coralli]|uniref:Wzz/FepE/Etk N-terminal domain-containing protein n=1 Tax=Alterisphingorhabdus coralli TaxID=3071408 RepID=A0AA97F5M7_9SPHN|nr:XrtA system polysaccharide chain length determinant [Parasphingorhabdus sp. SCSIO 66989]WOE73778.1 Wzz/FepE/Etk N-terminal domain-containing protein [Parasphingorhabdus sp. SCSIO 66989]